VTADYAPHAAWQSVASLNPKNAFAISAARPIQPNGRWWVPLLHLPL